MSLKQEGFVAEVTSSDRPLLTVFARSSKDLTHALGDKLSQLTMEEGVVLPKDAVVTSYSVKRIFGIKIQRTKIDTKLLG